MRFLIYGAGVIGCLYGAHLSKAGYSVTVYARGTRLEMLQKNGLFYLDNEKTIRANIRVISELKDNDAYDYIILAVRTEQLHDALSNLKTNMSKTILTMVNSLEEYESWEQLTGRGRILPGFPGAGGGWKNQILDASFTPAIIQRTTFGEINGLKSERCRELLTVFCKAGIPCEYVNDMHAWQLCHLAMVVPIADAYYETSCNPADTYKDKNVMRLTAERIHNNLKKLRNMGVQITPVQMKLLLLMPVGLLAIALRFIYHSKFGDKFMYQHAMKAPEEMRELHEMFYQVL